MSIKKYLFIFIGMLVVLNPVAQSAVQDDAGIAPKRPISFNGEPLIFNDELSISYIHELSHVAFSVKDGNIQCGSLAVPPDLVERVQGLYTTIFSQKDKMSQLVAGKRIVIEAGRDIDSCGSNMQAEEGITLQAVQKVSLVNSFLRTPQKIEITSGEVGFKNLFAFAGSEQSLTIKSHDGCSWLKSIEFSSFSQPFGCFFQGNLLLGQDPLTPGEDKFLVVGANKITFTFKQPKDNI